MNGFIEHDTSSPLRAGHVFKRIRLNWSRRPHARSPPIRVNLVPCSGAGLSSVGSSLSLQPGRSTLIVSPAPLGRQNTTAVQAPAQPPSRRLSRFVERLSNLGTVAQGLFLLLLWAAIYVASLAGTPVLDDADATHAQAADAMRRTGDLVTLHVNGIRYLEKPPLPYWITALSLRLFGRNSFAVHLPLALTVLALAWLAWHWGRRAFDRPTEYAKTSSPQVAGEPVRAGDSPEQNAPGNTGFYAALFVLTAAGVFLFTRIFIPDALLSLLLAVALYAALRALEPFSNDRRWALLFWLTLAAGVLTKGLVALAFPFAALALYLPLSGESSHWKRLRPLPGVVLLLAIAAPWHILAGLRNRGGAGGHGFFWFYFINEHVLRFLGRRYPPDYNKLPTALYWSLHLVWLFPWSFFAPVTLRAAWRMWRQWRKPRRASLGPAIERTFAARSVLLLALFSALVLLFFSFSTNQEYYTFPVYLPLLLLLAAALTRAESSGQTDKLLLACQAALTAVCLLAAAALALGLWSSRQLPAASDVGDLVAHRGVGGYTLSMSHFFDLTSASFSALRLPATLAGTALTLGSVAALALRLRNRGTAATVSLALMSTVFLVAAHLALDRFGSLLSSRRFAVEIKHLESTHAVDPGTQVLLYGDQALGSSIPFYLGRQVDLVDGRSTSMIFGSTFPDAPPIFLTPAQLRAMWGTGPRKLLFVPEEHRGEVDRLLGDHQILLDESAGKALVTDRPLALPSVDSVPRSRDNGSTP